MMPQREHRSPSPDWAVRLIGVFKGFGKGEPILKDLRLEVAPGEFLVLLGPSGCGKTTTLRLVAGLLEPDRGEIWIGGQPVAGRRWVPPERRPVGMVFQDYALFPHLTVAQNLLLGGHRLPPAERHRLLEELVDLFHLRGLEGRYPHELSGGEQQRVALARALMRRPEVLLLDEPFSNLDVALRAEVRAEVKRLLGRMGITVLFVTHDQEEALFLGHRVAVLWEGRIVQVAPPEELYFYPTTRQVAAFVGEANFLAGEASGETVRCELGELPLYRPMEGPVEVLIRPEAIRLLPQDEGQAEVVERRFFGHDQLLGVRLPSGRVLYSRCLGLDGLFPLGQRVAVRVRGKVVAYPAGGP